MPSLSPYTDFETASSHVLEYLHRQLGFQLWMVTRTETEDWIVLNSNDHGYGVKSGDVFRWTDSFCSRMVQGKGPRIAPRSNDIPAYAEAPIGRQVPIAAYVGVPLTRFGGELFGTLCAIDPQPMPVEVGSKLPLVEIMARLLMTVLENELKAQKEFRRAERVLAELMIDQLTQIYNRRGWENLLAKEDHRCQRYGNPACLLSIDLDDLKLVNDRFGHSHGDELLRRAAKAINDAVRESDIVARLGGDEFVVLSVDCDPVGAEKMLARLSASLEAKNISASVGMSMRHPPETLSDALEEADRAMYDLKRRRKGKNVAASNGNSLTETVQTASCLYR